MNYTARRAKDRTEIVIHLFIFFFFSSRRRHTRWPRDWSSDVCSSDLDGGRPLRDALAVPATADLSRRSHERAARSARVPWRVLRCRDGLRARQLVREAGDGTGLPLQLRSEERRVGKEGESVGWEIEGK